MKHFIDPKIDCVFKALLGSEANRWLLQHFLNAILGSDLRAPLTEVELLNPYNDREFMDDKLSIVDVKAGDAQGRQYQIEIQLLNLPELAARILYGWADLYSSQLREGEHYSRLRPTYAIWLLGQPLRPQHPAALHRLRLRDEQGEGLLDHGGIWLLELSKLQIERVESEQDRWLKFFIEGGRLNDRQLPAWMDTPEMRQAMSTLKIFSEKDRDYHAYQARQNYLRQQQSIQAHLEALTAQMEQTQAKADQAQAALAQAQADQERERAEKERALAEKERERAEKERALAEKERERAEKEQALAELARLKALHPPTDT